MGVHKPKKLNKEKILKKIITAILPGLVVAGFFVVANPTKKTSITAPVENGLVGYWKLDENPAIQETEIRDSSPFGNHGTLSTNDGENKSVEGKIARALSFDGVNDYVEVPYNPIFKNSKYTVEAWVKIFSYPPTSTQSFDITGMYQSGSNINSLQIYSDGKVQSNYNDGSWKVVKGETILELEKWYHLVAVIFPPNGYIYVNGKLDGSRSDIGTLILNKGNLRIATFVTAPDDYHVATDGFIDEVRIYNRALSADEIKEHYRGGMRRMEIQ